jgi:flagellar biosynthesis/type III secretory pathway chaperone
MNLWVVAAVVFFVLFLRERQRRLELANQKRKLIKRVTHLEQAIYPAAEAPAPAANAARELEELRARVQVLERIATDENSSEARNAKAIAAEIESLRGEIATRAATREEQSE